MNKQQKKWIILSIIGGFTVLLVSLSWNFFILKKYPEGIIVSVISSIVYTLASSIFTFFKYRENEKNI